MSNVFDDSIKIKEEIEKEERIEDSPEYKKLVEETNEKIRQDRIRQAKAIRRSKDYFAL